MTIILCACISWGLMQRMHFTLPIQCQKCMQFNCQAKFAVCGIYEVNDRAYKCKESKKCLRWLLILSLNHRSLIEYSEINAALCWKVIKIHFAN